MPLYKCEWPNGDVSFVLAEDVDDAVSRLDEFGAAEPRMIAPVFEFMIDLKPNRKTLEANARARKADGEEVGWPWELNEVGECLLDAELGVLPSEEKALRRIRKFEKEAKSAAAEQKLRARAMRDGSLVDLTERRVANAMKRARSFLQTHPFPVDEP